MLTLTDATVLAAASAILEREQTDIHKLSTPGGIRTSVHYELAKVLLRDTLIVAWAHADDYNAQVALDLDLNGRAPYRPNVPDEYEPPEGKSVTDRPSASSPEGEMPAADML